MTYKRAVLLDTSFFIRLLDRNDPLHLNAKGYFKYFTENHFELTTSTITIAEYCTNGSINDLPLKHLQTIPFNLIHAQRTGEFARIAFNARAKGNLQIAERKIIPNDTKLFAQADCEKAVELYLSSDTESLKVYNAIKTEIMPKFQFVDLNIPHYQTFGILDL